METEYVASDKFWQPPGSAVVITASALLALQVLSAAYYAWAGPDVFCEHAMRWEAFASSSSLVAILTVLLGLGFIAAAVAGSVRYGSILALISLFVLCYWRVGFFMMGMLYSGASCL